MASQPYLLGIDEAGRGPVLGPMVYAYAACPVAAKDELAAMGFADSKAINKQQRDALLAALQQSPLLLHHAIPLSPQQLSADMQRAARVSLNVISHDAAIALIVHAIEQRGLRLTEVYVDTVGDPRSYAEKLQALFPDVRFTVSAKADSLFPIVSAASIVAKCARDAAIQNWRFTETGRHSTTRQQQQHSSTTEFEHSESEEAESDSAVSGRKRTAAMAQLADDQQKDADQSRAAAVGSIDRDMGSGYPAGHSTHSARPLLFREHTA